jgi:hypothetical protein
MTVTLLLLHAILALTAVTVSVLGVQARSPERVRLMALLLLAAVVAQTTVGDVLYPMYLRTAKPALRALSAGARSAADLFEVKEHLAFFALVLSLGAFVLSRTEPKPTTLVRVLFGGAHGLIVLVATLGLAVASMRTP